MQGHDATKKIDETCVNVLDALDALDVHYDSMLANEESNMTTPCIGILGGTFDPPHEGHKFLSSKCLEMGMSKVLWVVSRKKLLTQVPDTNTATINKTIDKAAPKTTSTPECRAKMVEEILTHQNEAVYMPSSLHAIDTVQELKSLYPNASLLWICGSDILTQLHMWKDYARLLAMVPFIVFIRPTREGLAGIRYGIPILQEALTQRMAALQQSKQARIDMSGIDMSNMAPKIHIDKIHIESASKLIHLASSATSSHSLQLPVLGLATSPISTASSAIRHR